ncbi:MAG: hypothetical protein Q4A17_15635 [Thermoguttaceae bacterium]|nr:hypothetical protein [Thermoguttaceae bacterium]
MIKAQNDSLSPSSHKNIKSKTRDLRMESLEERQLLSVSPVSAASDDVDYACIAPAEMVPMESAPVVEINLTDEVPTLDAPVALAADTTAPISFQDYTFTPDGSFTYEENGNTITISAGNVTVTGGSADPVNIVYSGTGTLTVDTDLAAGNSITMNSGALSVVSGRTIADVTSSGCAISGEGTISALNMASGTTTINGGTITAASGSGAVVIEGTTGSDTFTIGQTVTVGTTSVTFDTGCSSNVTINGGAGNDTFNVTAAPTSGSLTLNGGVGTDILSNNTNVALASTGIEIISSASGSVIVVTASSETADTDATISLSEAFAFFNDATVTGDYKIGFAPNIADTYLLDRALTSTYENTGHKLTIDGSQNRYDPATGQVVSQSANAVTVEARYDDTTTGSTYLQVNAGTTVEIVGLNLQHGNEGPWSRVHGITNSGTLTLIDGVRIHGFRTDGIVNYGTLTLGKDTTETQSPVSIYHNGFNEGNGIVNTGSGAVLTVYSALITGESDSQGTEKYGIYNVNGATSHLYGATADAVTISYHRNSGIYNDATSTVDITGASVINNHGIGIENEGELKIGETSSSAENVKILSNATDEIRNNATGKRSSASEK